MLPNRCAETSECTFSAVTAVSVYKNDLFANTCAWLVIEISVLSNTLWSDTAILLLEYRFNYRVDPRESNQFMETMWLCEQRWGAPWPRITAKGETGSIHSHDNVEDKVMFRPWDKNLVRTRYLGAVGLEGWKTNSRLRLFWRLFCSRIEGCELFPL